VYVTKMGKECKLNFVFETYMFNFLYLDQIGTNSVGYTHKNYLK
jgi:hypothetical protein